MGETINNPQGILGILKVPGTPKSEKGQHFSILGNMSGEHDFSTLERKNAKMVSPLFGVPGTFKTPSIPCRFLMVLTMGHNFVKMMGI